MSNTNYLGVPEDTLNKVVTYLLDRPYREVSELLKLLESDIVTIRGAVPSTVEESGNEGAETASE
jgi:hypothetical protein